MKYIVAHLSDGVQVLEYDRASQKYFTFARTTSVHNAQKIADALNKEEK